MIPRMTSKAVASPIIRLQSALAHDADLVQRMLTRLHALVSHELSEEKPPFDLDLFGTRKVTY